ncbi:MAG: hypothetical protein K6T59_10075, partial [Bryobacteraceae bacterium]|nr:hypothetical protein [Bryobacteraceae bacterium]
TQGVRNRITRFHFPSTRLCSDGGLILVRELDGRLGLGELIEPHLRTGRREQLRRLSADQPGTGRQLRCA